MKRTRLRWCALSGILLLLTLILAGCRGRSGGKHSGPSGSPDLSVGLGANTPVACERVPGGADNVVLQVALRAGVRDVTVLSIRFHGFGSGDEVSGISGARLHRDLNGDGSLDAGDTPLGAPERYSADDGALLFSGLGERIPGSVLVNWLLVYDLAPGPFSGNSFCVELSDANDLVAIVSGGPAKVDLETGISACSTLPWSSLGDDQTRALFGGSVSSAGDVNGDGLDDVIVGAERFGTATGKEGKAYVYHGRSSGLPATADWTSSGDNRAVSCFGGCVASAGDVNGDGFADVIVGAWEYSTNEPTAGKAFLYLGGSAGLSPTPAWTSSGDNEAGALFGFCVASAGDVNADGFDDVAFGSWRSAGYQEAGRAHLYLGGPAGLDASPGWASSGENQTFGRFGASIASAGDVNGDGFDDVIVGAQGMNSAEGKAYVYFGGPGGISPTPAWTANGDGQPGAWFGESVATAGDVDGDGFAEVIIGAWMYSTTKIHAGKAYLYRGGPAGLSSTPAWTSSGDDEEYVDYGECVASAGDVNGDGFSDVIVAAPGGPLSPVAGKVFLYLGGASGLSANPAWTSTGDSQLMSRFGYSVASAGDLTGQGLDSIVVGAMWFDTPNVDAGKVYLFSPCTP